jgi:hypothetical protein
MRNSITVLIYVIMLSVLDLKQNINEGYVTPRAMTIIKAIIESHNL